MKRTQSRHHKLGPRPVRCSHCGRELAAGLCTNLRCPGISWRNSRSNGTNVVELQARVERGPSDNAFVGALYTKEIRIVDGCECQGVSISTLGSGTSKKDLVQRLVAVARERAQHYSARGYKVVLTKLLAA